MKKLIIATRGSKLALWQSNYIKNSLQKIHENLEVELKIIKTKGDKILDTPLAKIGGKGLFTKELENAMLEKKAHIAVHSLKDVPVDFSDGLMLGAITKREDESDVLLLQKYKSFNELPKNAIIGTTSLRRRMQLLQVRNDLNIKDLRGNVNTRIQKLKNHEYDGIILAYAGLKRLDLFHEVKHYEKLHFMIPAMGQAALGIECLNDEKILNLIKPLNDEKTYIQTKVERDFVRVLEGGCQVPIGINAKLKDDKIHIKYILGLPNASEIIQDEIVCDISQYHDIGEQLANKAISKGAKELLKKAQNMAINEIF